MGRDIDKFKQSTELHLKWQLDYFNTLRSKLIEKAKWHKDNFYDLEMWDALLTEAEKMKFQFDKSEVAIQFGNCKKLDKDVIFIPNVLQLSTQSCFTHRRDAGN
jgi:hypothetical protein